MVVANTSGHCNLRLQQAAVRFEAPTVRKFVIVNCQLSLHSPALFNEHALFFSRCFSDPRNPARDSYPWLLSIAQRDFVAPRFTARTAQNSHIVEHSHNRIAYTERVEGQHRLQDLASLIAHSTAAPASSRPPVEVRSAWALVQPDAASSCRLAGLLQP